MKNLFKKSSKNQGLITGLTPRPKTAHKGLFGNVLVIGGDYGMPGAVKLAATGALKLGAGLVTVITRPEHLSSVTGTKPELLCYGLDISQLELFTHLLCKASMIVLGPGLGESSWSEFLFDTTIQHINTHQTPCLVDADGLNWLAEKSWTPQSHCIFTPHPGEAARLLQSSTQNIQSNREESIKKLQKKLGGVIVLKGAESLVYTSSQSIYQCNAGNPAMASGGMGDLLSGIVSGFVTQGLSLFDASQQGVLLHATAGDRALKKQGGPGLLASDLIPELKPLLNFI